VNDKVYIHEFIDITKQNRARYMHHMAANWSPLARQKQGQLCYGIWGAVGSTGRWPQVVNIWEEDGFDGLASSFRHELGHVDLQDPDLAAWWAAAADLRSGGLTGSWSRIPTRSPSRAVPGGGRRRGLRARTRPGRAGHRAVLP